MIRDSRIEIRKSAPEMLSSEKLRNLHAYWLQLKGAAELPRRDDLSPVDLGTVLGQVTMVDVKHQPLSFYYRLIGTRVEELGRLGDQGRTVDQIRPAWYRELCRDAYREAVESGQPLCLLVSCDRSDDGVSYERMVLPFTKGGTAVEVLLDTMDWAPGMQIELKRVRLVPSANVPVDLVLS